MRDGTGGVVGLNQDGGDADRAAFQARMARHIAHVQSLLASEMGSRLKKRVELEDLTQETLLRAFRARKLYRGRSERHFRHWLSAIARNVVRDQARRLSAQKADARREVSMERRVEAGGGAPVTLGERLVASVDPPSRCMRREERFERLRRALARLSPSHREVILIVRVQGVPVKEAARRMGRSPGATSVLLLRALLRLKAAFGHTDSFHLPRRDLEEKGGADE